MSAWQSLDTAGSLQENAYPPNNHQQTASSSVEYSDVDDEEYQTESDSEYEDIVITRWGDRAKQKEPLSWNTLLDHSVKVKAGGIGSGDLHRRGGNFKPLSEAAILAQRLSKGVPSKKSATSGKPKKPKKKKPTSSAPKPKPAAAPVTVGFAAGKNKPYVPVYKPSVPARAPIKDPSASTWGSMPLSETPFWETKPEPPKHTALTIASSTVDSSYIKPPVQQFNQLTLSQNVAVDKPENQLLPWGSEPPTEIVYSLNSSTLKRKPVLISVNLPSYSIAPTMPTAGTPEPEPAQKPATNTTTTTTTKWNIEAQGFNPSKGFNPVLKPEVLKWNTNLPSFVPSTLSASTSSSSAQSGPLAYNAEAPVFIPTFVPPPSVKKILKISAPTPKDETPTATLPQQQQQQQQRSRIHLDQSLLRKHLEIKQPLKQTEKSVEVEQEQQHPQSPQPQKQPQFQSKPSDHDQLKSQTQPESTRGFENQEPFLRINLEISEGISATMIVQEGSDPNDLVEDFAVTHKLRMTDKAKSNMASFVADLIEKKKNKKSYGLLD